MGQGHPGQPRHAGFPPGFYPGPGGAPAGGYASPYGPPAGPSHGHDPYPPPRSHDPYPLHRPEPGDVLPGGFSAVDGPVYGTPSRLANTSHYDAPQRRPVNARPTHPRDDYGGFSTASRSGPHYQEDYVPSLDYSAPGYKTPRFDAGDFPVVPPRGFRSNPSTPSKPLYRSPYIGATLSSDPVPFRPLQYGDNVPQGYVRPLPYVDDVPQEYIRPLTSLPSTYRQEIRPAAPVYTVGAATSRVVKDYILDDYVYPESPVREYVRRPVRQSLGSPTIFRAALPPAVSAPLAGTDYISQPPLEYAQRSLVREYAPAAYTPSGISSASGLASEQGIITSEGISEYGTRMYTREYTRRVGDSAVAAPSVASARTDAAVLSAGSIASSSLFNSSEPVITSEGISEYGTRMFTREYIRPLGSGGLAGVASNVVLGGAASGSVGRAGSVTRGYQEPSQVTATQTAGLPSAFGTTPNAPLPAGALDAGTYVSPTPGVPPPAPLQAPFQQPPQPVWQAGSSLTNSLAQPVAAPWPSIPSSTWPAGGALHASGLTAPPFGAHGLPNYVPPPPGQLPPPGAPPTFDGSAIPNLAPIPLGGVPGFQGTAASPPSFPGFPAPPTPFDQGFGSGFAANGFPSFPPPGPVTGFAPGPTPVASSPAPASAEFVPTQDLWAAAPTVLPAYSGESAPLAFTTTAPAILAEALPTLPLQAPGIPAGGPLDDLDN